MSDCSMNIDKYSNFRLSPKYPTMPPYHKGDYIEKFFYDFYQHNSVEDIEYISVFWTAYIDNPKHDIVVPPQKQLQQLLDSLDKEKQYFTLIQSSNGINFNLPPKTKVFSCAGNGVWWPIKSNDIVPIPLIASPLESKDGIRDIFCSFVGSDTHECRKRLRALLLGKKDCVFEMGSWNWTFESDKVARFTNYMNRSVFSLCPRGFGPTSYRLYESMQLGSIPVYIYDDAWLPYSNEVDWEKICVMIHIDQIEDTYEILKSKTEDDIESYRKSIKEHQQEYFSFEGVCNQIVKSL